MSFHQPSVGESGNENNEDLSLVQGMVEGNEHALRQLMQRHTTRFYFVVRRILGPEVADEDIEEVLSDSFLRAWEIARTYDPRIASAYTWLRTIVVYAALSKRRQIIRGSRHESASIHDEQMKQRTQEIPEVKEDEDTALWLAEALHKLRRQWPNRLFQYLLVGIVPWSIL